MQRSKMVSFAGTPEFCRRWRRFSCVFGKRIRDRAPKERGLLSRARRALLYHKHWRERVQMNMLSNDMPLTRGRYRCVHQVESPTLACCTTARSSTQSNKEKSGKSGKNKKWSPRGAPVKFARCVGFSEGESIEEQHVHRLPIATSQCRFRHPEKYGCMYAALAAR